MTPEEIKKLYETEGLRGFGLEKLSEIETRAADVGASINQITAPFGSSAGFNLGDPTLNREIEQKLASLNQLRSAGINLDFPNIAKRLGVAGFSSVGGQQPINPPAGQFNLPAMATGVINPPQSQPIQQLQQQGGQPQYVKIPSPTGDTYFQQSPQGLQAISDPNILRGLKSGQISSTPQEAIESGAQRFAPQPQQAQPQQGIQQPQQPQQPQLSVSTDTNDLFQQFGLEPGATIEDVIKSVSAAFGLNDITSEIKKLDDEQIDKIMEVNTNPWLSESLRTKKVAQIQEGYEKKKTALIDRLKLQGDVVGKAITVWQNERELKKDLLFKALDMKQKEIEAKKTIIKPTSAEINAETYDAAKLRAAQLFKADRQRNTDKMVNPNLYYQIRQEVPVLYRDDFDRAFQYLLSEESKARFGILPSKKTQEEEIENPFD